MHSCIDNVCKQAFPSSIFLDAHKHHSFYKSKWYCFFPSLNKKYKLQCLVCVNGKEVMNRENPHRSYAFKLRPLVFVHWYCRMFSRLNPHHSCNELIAKLKRGYIRLRLNKYMPKEGISCSEETYRAMVLYSGNKEFQNHARLSTPILSQMPGICPNKKFIKEKKTEC